MYEPHPRTAAVADNNWSAAGHVGELDWTVSDKNTRLLANSDQQTVQFFDELRTSGWMVVEI